MAILTNSLLTFSAIGNREDLSNTIFNIDPVETPFMGNIGKNKAEAVLHEWQTQALAAAAANAVIEGDDTTSSYTFTAATVTVRAANRCQISRKDVVVSGTQDAVSKAGRAKEIVYQMVLKNKELRRDMEFVLTNNQAPVTGNSTTARQLRPALSWYSTNVSAGSGGSSGSTTTATTRICRVAKMSVTGTPSWRALVRSMLAYNCGTLTCQLVNSPASSGVW